MENSNFIIRIAEPCHENWNNMLPDPKGKFCTSCSKSVIDFSDKTDDQIHNILLQHKDQKMCGRFIKTQINRPLNITIDLNSLPKHMSSTRTFAIAALLVFGTFLFSCTDMQGQKVNTIEVINTLPEEYTVGDIAIPLQREDTIPKKEIIPSEISIPEIHVAGGISFERFPIAIDSIAPIKEEKIEELMGLMIIDPEEKDTTATDSMMTNRTGLFDQPLTDNKPTDLLVYPNPTTGEFTIKYDVTKRADVQIDILDNKGAIIKTLVNVSAQFEGKYNIPVNVNDLPNGVYIVSLINNGNRFSDRLIIQK